VIGVAEVGFCFERVVDGRVMDVLRTVVVGNGTTDVVWLVGEAVENSGLDVFGVVSRDLGDLEKAGLPLQENVEGCSGGARDHGICFPVAELTSRVDGVGPFVDENPLGDRELFGFSREIFFSTFGVATGEEGDQLFFISIDELIDRFVRDGIVRKIHGNPSCNKLRGPTQFYFSDHIIPDDGIFQARSYSRSPFSSF